MGAHFEALAALSPENSSAGTAKIKREFLGKKFNCLPFTFLAEMRISLNRSQFFPTSKFLSCPKISLSYYQSAGEYMPKYMRHNVR
jgi:hypothetical protein